MFGLNDVEDALEDGLSMCPSNAPADTISVNSTHTILVFIVVLQPDYQWSRQLPDVSRISRHV